MAALQSTTCLTPIVMGGDLKLKNRIALAPLTRARSHADGIPKDHNVEYYVQRGTYFIPIRPYFCELLRVPADLYAQSIGGSIIATTTACTACSYVSQLHLHSFRWSSHL